MEGGTEAGSTPQTPKEASSGPTKSERLVMSDFSSSFELGQLVFVVGHVAIKHIVYLELVERELKRRKEEKTAHGALIFPSYRRSSKRIGTSADVVRLDVP
jgi:hypothetical protein